MEEVKASDLVRRWSDGWNWYDSYKYPELSKLLDDYIGKKPRKEINDLLETIINNESLTAIADVLAENHNLLQPYFYGETCEINLLFSDYQTLPEITFDLFDIIADNAEGHDYPDKYRLDVATGLRKVADRLEAISDKEAAIEQAEEHAKSSREG